MWEWFWAHPHVMWWAGVFSAASFVGALLIIPPLIARMPADYFISRRPPDESWRARHPAIRWTVLILKNLLGVILAVLGAVMLVGPGQGLLTILIGISLVNFPGKRRLEIWILRQRLVWKSINWIRKRAKRPPLVLPDGIAEHDVT